MRIERVMSRDDHDTRDEKPATAVAPGTPIRQVPIAWEALEDAFENNAPEVHSYLHLETGEVIRIVDGIADPQMHQRVMNDTTYLRVEPVSSREQYRWMERFIATVEESEFRDKLVQAIDGKGAFRRFKDVLMSYPVDRERWFAFRSERLRACMEGWLQAHAIEAVQRQQWRVPTADEVRPAAEESDKPARRNRAAIAEAHRRRLHELADQLPARELDAAVAFLEFLRERKHLPRPKAKGEGTVEAGADTTASSETSLDLASEPPPRGPNGANDERADEPQA
ncbi:hypothetical protein DB32_002561 [Sandaracinus amylolyticus]|uniref:Uncharacterized protein n=2 Tax=Sandaracinus amylolyticus TaxID=927083 RepID=A0A0F6W1Y3_9BACT|nr:hypothetical protein DB32_002561 [Sandaracinus amylolyticus]